MVDTFSTAPWQRSDRRPPYRPQQWPQRCRQLIAALVAAWSKVRESEASTGITRQSSEPTPVITVWPQTHLGEALVCQVSAEPSAAPSDIHHAAREPRLAVRILDRGARRRYLLLWKSRLGRLNQRIIQASVMELATVGSPASSERSPCCGTPGGAAGPGPFGRSQVSKT